MIFLQRYIHVLVLIYGAGALCFLHVPNGSRIVIGSIGAVASVLYGIFFKIRHKNYHHLVILALAVFCTGYITTHTVLDYKSHELVTKSYEKQNITGLIHNIQSTAKNTKYTIRIQSAEDKDLTNRSIKFTYHNKNTHADIGDVVAFKGRIMPLNDPITPYAYNFKRAAYFDGLDGVGTVYGTFKILQRHTSSLKTLRHNLTRHIVKTLKSPESAIATALITGDKGRIPPEIRTMFADSGIAHILAISGLHITLVAGIIFFAIRRILGLYAPLTRSINLKKYAAIFSMPFILLYCGLSGFGYPAIRALIMTAFVMMAICYDRTVLSQRSVVLAALFLCIFWPECLLSASFQLSFAAVTALIAFYESRWGIFLQRVVCDTFFKKITKYFTLIMMTTLIATLATTPLTIYIFKKFTLQGFLGNILAIPLTSFLIMPLAVLSVLTYFIFSTNLAFYAFEYCITLLIGVAEYISQLPAAGITVPQPHYGFMICFAIGFLWICFIHHRIRHLGWIMMLGCIYFMTIDHLPHIYALKNGLIVVRHDDHLMATKNQKWHAFEMSILSQETGQTDVKTMPSLYIYNNVGIWDTPWKNKDINTQQFCKQTYLISNGYIKKYCKNKRYKRIYDRQSTKYKHRYIFTKIKKFQNRSKNASKILEDQYQFLTGFGAGY